MHWCSGGMEDRRSRVMEWGSVILLQMVEKDASATRALKKKSEKAEGQSWDFVGAGRSRQFSVS